MTTLIFCYRYGSPGKVDAKYKEFADFILKRYSRMNYLILFTFYICHFIFLCFIDFLLISLILLKTFIEILCKKLFII